MSAGLLELAAIAVAPAAVSLFRWTRGERTVGRLLNPFPGIPPTPRTAWTRAQHRRVLALGGAYAAVGSVIGFALMEGSERWPPGSTIRAALSFVGLAVYVFGLLSWTWTGPSLRRTMALQPADRDRARRVENQPVLEWVARVGGAYVWNRDEFSVDLANVPLSDREAAALLRLGGLDKLSVNASALSFAAIAGLVRLPGLRLLELSGSRLREPELEALRRIGPGIDLY